MAASFIGPHLERGLPPCGNPENPAERDEEQRLHAAVALSVRGGILRDGLVKEVRPLVGVLHLLCDIVVDRPCLLKICRLPLCDLLRKGAEEWTEQDMRQILCKVLFGRRRISVSSVYRCILGPEVVVDGGGDKLILRAERFVLCKVLCEADRPLRRIFRGNHSRWRGGFHQADPGDLSAGLRERKPHPDLSGAEGRILDLQACPDAELPCLPAGLDNAIHGSTHLPGPLRDGDRIPLLHLSKKDQRSPAARAGIHQGLGAAPKIPWLSMKIDPVDPSLIPEGSKLLLCHIRQECPAGSEGLVKGIGKIRGQAL